MQDTINRSWKYYPLTLPHNQIFKQSNIFCFNKTMLLKIAQFADRLYCVFLETISTQSIHLLKWKKVQFNSCYSL